MLLFYIIFHSIAAAAVAFLVTVLLVRQVVRPQQLGAVVLSRIVIVRETGETHQAQGHTAVARVATRERRGLRRHGQNTCGHARLPNSPLAAHRIRVMLRLGANGIANLHELGVGGRQTPQRPCVRVKGRVRFGQGARAAQ